MEPEFERLMAHPELRADPEGGVVEPRKEKSGAGPQSTEELLHAIGAKNPLPLYVTVTMSFLWCLSVMPTMSPAYTAPAKDPQDGFVTIQKEFKTNKLWIIEAAELTSSVFFLGNFCLGQLYCMAADRLGRRPVLVFCVIFSGISGMFSAIAPTFELMLLGRFFQGSFFSAITMVNWVMCCESISFSAHGVAAVLFGLFWVVGYCILTPMAIVFMHWRKVQMATSLPCFLFGILMYFTLPESISFLITKRRRTEAVEWIKKAEKIGKKTVDCDIDSIIEYETATVPDEASIVDTLLGILKRRDLVVFVAIQSAIWFVDFLVYSVLSLNSTAIGGSHHSNFFYSGLIEIPCYLFVPVALDFFGRKPTVMMSHIVPAVSLMLMFILGQVGYEGGTTFLLVWLVAKFGMACGFMCCFVYGAECFPVQYRNICLGLCATVSNLGAMSAPHFDFLSEIYPHLEYAIFAVATLVCAVLVVWLPETKQKKTN